MTARCVALLLALAVPALAQSAPRDADAERPAARRLRQLVGAIERGGEGHIRAFVREAYTPELLRRIGEDRVVRLYAMLSDASRGLEVDSLRATSTEAAALLRARLTGLWQPLSLRVEPQPPHRIIDVSATTGVKLPKHPLAAATASDAERAREIERIARKLSAVDAFSGVVLVARGDTILYLGAFGDADKERRITIRADTRFALASITKTFVTVAVAKLVEEGRLSWDDSLGKFFPELPLAQAREKVRIKHLLTHTSGLRQEFTVREILLAQKDSLLYEPGTRSAYNNGNFVLLGRIIELASGQPFYQYIREQVFRPAGMHDTDFDELHRVHERRAVAYDKQYTDEGVRFVREAPRPEPGVEEPAAFAGAHSTAHDLYRFARALRSGRILRPATVDLLFSPKPEAGNWGYGFDILDEERGLVGHGGSAVGMNASLDMFTRSGYTAVVLSNYTFARSPLREAIWSIVP
jgi:CubicO group peptidase (beta-lactamase class C family)